MKPESLPDRPLRATDLESLRSYDYRLVEAAGWYHARGAEPVAYELVVIGEDWMAGYIYNSEWRRVFREDVAREDSARLLYHLAVEELGVGHVPGDGLEARRA